MRRIDIADFEKVSLSRFCKDWEKLFGSVSHTEMEIIDIYNRIKNPRRATYGSAGYDIFSPIHLIIEPGESCEIPTGIRCKIEPEWFMGILPRSGHGFKYGLRVINTMGVIDNDYYFSDNEGHIFLKLINDSSVKSTVDIETGEGVAQAIFFPYGLATGDYVSEKRNGGFGSTTCFRGDNI